MRQIFFLSIGFCFVLIMGCSSQPSEKVIRYQENNEIIGEEKDELIGDISPTIYETVDRNNEDAEEVIIFPVERPGSSVIPPPGRYTIYPNQVGGDPIAGRVVVYDENEVLLVEETIDSNFGLSGVTVNLDGSHTVYIDGLDHVSIVPTPNEGSSNELGAGIWEVGKDIEPGNYTVEAESDYFYGYLQLFEEGKEPRVFEILNNPTRSTVNVDLEEGQILKITGLSYLKFD